jgi:hypothetical protein
LALLRISTLYATHWAPIGSEEGFWENGGRRVALRLQRIPGPLTTASPVDAEVLSVCLYPYPHAFVAVRWYVREVRGRVLGASKHRE